MKIWAHRGCSQMYPENTITSFEKAMNIPGLEGIELDIQLTRDGEIVVIHDERVDRTTDGKGFVRDYTLSELKTLKIDAGEGRIERIPTMREVLDLLAPKLRAYAFDKFNNAGSHNGIRLNIELKNSVFPYPGMEKMIVDMMEEYGVADAIVYSSFYAKSLVLMHELVPEAELGTLNAKMSDCMYKALGIESIYHSAADSPTRGNLQSQTAEFRLALHPGAGGEDLPPAVLEGRTIRMYFGGHLYPEKPTPGKMDLDKLATAGVTDVFLNEPEKYLCTKL